MVGGTSLYQRQMLPEYELILARALEKGADFFRLTPAGGLRMDAAQDGKNAAANLQDQTTSFLALSCALENDSNLEEQ